MEQFAADEGAWREAYALAFQRLSEAATDLPPPHGVGTGAGASWAAWLGLEGWSDGALAAMAVGAAAAVGAGVWWAAQQRRLRRVPIR